MLTLQHRINLLSTLRQECATSRARQSSAIAFVGQAHGLRRPLRPPVSGISTRPHDPSMTLNAAVFRISLSSASPVRHLRLHNSLHASRPCTPRASSHHDGQNARSAPARPFSCSRLVRLVLASTEYGIASQSRPSLPHPAGSLSKPLSSPQGNTAQRANLRHRPTFLTGGELTIGFGVSGVPNVQRYIEGIQVAAGQIGRAS